MTISSTTNEAAKMHIPGSVRRYGPGNKIPLAEVQRMYRDYASGRSLSETARMHNRSRRGVAELFNSRGLPLRRTIESERAHGNNGCFVAQKKATDAEVETLVKGLTRACIPPSLKWEFRNWPRDRRNWFVGLLKRYFPDTYRRWPGKYSANVEPFDYTSETAHAIARAANAGLDSQRMIVKLKLASHGVIWKRQLYFGCLKDTAYYAGPFKPGIGRPVLHHLIWEEANGRPVPDKQTVIFKDGNKNNFTPANLVLRSMADCARENITRYRLRKSRETTALLFKRHLAKHHDHTRNETKKLDVAAVRAATFRLEKRR